MSPSPADARANDDGARRRLLVVSPWESVWSMDEAHVKAGVSDDDRFIDGFVAAGWELHFLRPRSQRRDPRVHLHFYPNFFRATRALPTFLRRPLWPLLFNALVAPRALSLARATDARLVLGHSHYATFTTWFVGRRLRLPGVVKLFGVMDLVHTEWPAPKYWFKNCEQLFALRFPQDGWIVLDDGTRGGEILRGRGIPAERIHFLPNGLDLEWLDRRADRAQARARLGLAAGARVVLFLARLVPSKRPLDCVRAGLALARRDRDVVVVVAGDGPERLRCEREAGGTEGVRFVGTVPHEEVPDLMAAADVFVSTSTLTNRALPTCEAMLCGVPVVAYDTGDTATVVRAGETGALVRDGDVAALADAIGLLLGSESVRTRMGEAARRLARETFVSWDARIAAELAIVEGLAKR